MISDNTKIGTGLLFLVSPHSVESGTFASLPSNSKENKICHDIAALYTLANPVF